MENIKAKSSFSILNFNFDGLIRVCGKKFFVGVGCGVWGVFQVVNYLIFREKVTEFFPDHSNGRHFLGGKKSKNLIQQSF